MSQPEQVFCPNCKGGNAATANVCQWCGTSLRPGAPVQYTAPPQQPQPVQQVVVEKKRRRACAPLLIGALVVGMIAVLAAGLSGNKPPASNVPQATARPTTAAGTAPTVEANQPQATNTTAPEAPTELTIGSTGDIDGVKVTLNEVRHETEGIVPAKEGMEYVILNVTLENGTNKNQAFSTLLNMSLKDDTGQKYTDAFGAKKTDSPGGQVVPGDKLRGEVAYEVPKTATGLRFIYAPFLNQKQLTFKLDR
jgi:hypothetical protein